MKLKDEIQPPKKTLYHQLQANTKEDRPQELRGGITEKYLSTVMEKDELTKDKIDM